MLAENYTLSSGTSPWGMSGASPIHMVLYLFSTKGLLEDTLGSFLNSLNRGFAGFYTLGL